MKGIKKVAGESKVLTGDFRDGIMQINYDKATGEVWSDFINFGGRVLYPSDDIITAGTVCAPVTMDKVRKIIENALES